jgi:type VI secretion system secreted protein Hcp
MTVKFKTQGHLKGSSTSKNGDLDFSKGLECHGYKFDMTTQYDAASGLPSGKRMHKPIVIVREIDKASPLLFHAMASDDTFQVATLYFNKPGPGEKPSNVRTIELTNGAIVDIIQLPQTTGKNKSQAITLVYEAIKVNGVPGGHIPGHI